MATPAGIFLSFDTDIQGESRVRGHEGHIDVESWSWSQSQSGSVHERGGGKVTIGDLIVQKGVDAATPALLAACSTSRHIKRAVLMQRKAGTEVPAYFTITMTDVLVTSVTHTSCREPDDGIDETVTLNFSKVEVEYHPLDDKGAFGPAKTYTWDIDKNTA